LAQYLYFLIKITNFWGQDTGLSVWRVSKTLEDTVDWFDKIFSVKNKFKEGMEWNNLYIVDPLGVNKQMENFIKVWIKDQDPHGISAVEPNEYLIRFNRAIKTIIK